MSWILSRPDGAILRVHIQPKASRTEWVGLFGSGDDVRVKLRIAAPPVDGAANEEIVSFVRKALKPLGPISVQILRGESSRQKDLALTGVGAEAIRAFVLAALG